MGSRNHHYACCWCPILYNFLDNAQVYHEESSDQGHLSVLLLALQFNTLNSNILNLLQTGDFGYYVFGKSRIAYEFSGFMLLANNILLIGFHILTAAKILNTLSDHSLCTVSFSAIGTVIGIVMSLPRTLKHVSFMSIFSGK
jgi:hypothetical protein